MNQTSLFQFNRNSGKASEENNLWIAYTAFHLGDYKKSMEVKICYFVYYTQSYRAQLTAIFPVLWQYMKARLRYRSWKYLLFFWLQNAINTRSHSFCKICHICRADRWQIRNFNKIFYCHQLVKLLLLFF